MPRKTHPYLTLMSLLLLFCFPAATPFAQRTPAISGPIPSNKIGYSEQEELSDLKSDVAQMQALLNQMQANFSLVGNPTTPANHELELNMDMWRVLLGQMQRRISRLEQANSSRSK